MPENLKSPAKWGKYEVFALAAGALWFGLSDWLTGILWTGANTASRFGLRTVLFFPVFVGIVMTMRWLKTREGKDG